jgi:ABC-type Mn2+/Zn2+ transport system ATPase subunit
VRVSIARGLVQRPALLLIDDAITGAELMKRDRILDLLRSLRDDGVAILSMRGQRHRPDRRRSRPLA